MKAKVYIKNFSENDQHKLIEYRRILRTDGYKLTMGDGICVILSDNEVDRLMTNYEWISMIIPISNPIPINYPSKKK